MGGAVPFAKSSKANGEEKYIENGITQEGEGNDVSSIIYRRSRQLLTSPQSYSNLPPLAMFHRKPFVSVRVRRITEEVNSKKTEIIVICDCGSESEDGDGIEMIRCPFILEHGVASNLSKIVWMWKNLWLHPISQGLLTVG